MAGLLSLSEVGPTSSLEGMDDIGGIDFRRGFRKTGPRGPNPSFEQIFNKRCQTCDFPFENAKTLKFSGQLADLAMPKGGGGCRPPSRYFRLGRQTEIRFRSRGPEAHPGWPSFLSARLSEAHVLPLKWWSEPCGDVRDKTCSGSPQR